MNLIRQKWTSKCLFPRWHLISPKQIISLNGKQENEWSNSGKLMIYEQLLWKYKNNNKKIIAIYAYFIIYHFISLTLYKWGTTTRTTSLLLIQTSSHWWFLKNFHCHQYWKLNQASCPQMKNENGVTSYSTQQCSMAWLLEWKFRHQSSGNGTRTEQKFTPNVSLLAIQSSYL